MEMIRQLASGKYTRQFFEPNSKSPGSLKIPNLPSTKNNKPAATIISPRKIKSLPICCGPKSIFSLSKT
jgi:ABC-type enterochelin transport system substrate-binding protein